MGWRLAIHREAAVERRVVEGDGCREWPTAQHPTPGEAEQPPRNPQQSSKSTVKSSVRARTGTCTSWALGEAHTYTNNSEYMPLTDFLKSNIQNPNDLDKKEKPTVKSLLD